MVTIRVATIIIHICCSILCQAQCGIKKPATLLVISLETRVSQLRKAYSELSLSPTNPVLQIKYFETFPEEFDDFRGLFGFKKDDNGKVKEVGPLSDDALAFVLMFFQLDEIEQSMVYCRIIEICSTGRWDADGVNYFQHEMIKLMLTKTKDFIQVLNTRARAESEGFWKFFFDGPHPMTKIPSELVSLEMEFPEVFRMITQAHSESKGRASH